MEVEVEVEVEAGKFYFPLASMNLQPTSRYFQSLPTTLENYGKFLTAAENRENQWESDFSAFSGKRKTFPLN